MHHCSATAFYSSFAHCILYIISSVKQFIRILYNNLHCNKIVSIWIEAPLLSQLEHGDPASKGSQLGRRKT